MKYALPGFVAVVAVALLIALLVAPSLAQWFADTLAPAAGGGYSYGRYGYEDYGYAQQSRWPVGSLWLILSFIGFAVLGGGVMAMAWLVSIGTAVEEPDPKARRRKKAQALIEAVQRRGDLSTGEKESFESSALALADSDDPTSIRAAELVGAGDAVTGANGLASEAENDFLQFLRHAANIALPFSDSTAKRIDKRRGHFAEIDALVKDRKAYEELKDKCGEDGAGDSAKAKGNHARLDFVWDCAEK